MPCVNPLMSVICFAEIHLPSSGIGIGYHLANGYGMSEIGITSVELSENNRILNSGTIGMPMVSVAYKINEDGELLVKGTSLCKYYIENGDTVYINEDWFRTKDLAVEKNDRFYTPCGR